VAVPEPFVGCWVRDGVSVADEPLVEPADVMWLQGREWFVDVRVPRPGVVAGPATSALGARVEAFGGRCSWSSLAGVPPAAGGRLDWDHEIDFSGGFADGDGAEVRWVTDGWFEEHGDLGDGDPPTAFREVWRVGGQPEPVLAVVGLAAGAHDEGVRVAALVLSVGGDRVLLVGSEGLDGFCWSHARQDEGGVWRPLRRHAPAVGDLEPADAPPVLRAAEETADWLCSLENGPETGYSFVGEGMEWVVTESRGAVHDDVHLSKQYRNTFSVRSSS
jgi:hypothetical protein